MLEQRLMDLEEFHDVYTGCLQQHFPPAEVKPFAIVEKAFHEKKYLPYGYYEEGKLMAYTLLFQEGDTLLLDYFAVMESLRGKGRGSEILALMKENLGEGRTIFLEVEEPNAEDEKEHALQERRIRFYLRNGARMAGVKGDVFSVVYEIMTIGGQDQGEKAKRAMETLYHSMLDEETYQKNIFFHREGEESEKGE